MKKVAVVGAGISGLVVARRLQTLAEVTLFEKSRGPGGRMATRYAGDFEFDHGAQYFTARSEEFRAFLKPLIDSGIVDVWRATSAEFDRSEMEALQPWGDERPRYVGAPRMNSVGKALAKGLQIAFETRITAITRTRNAWTVTDDEGLESGPFDWVILTAPAAQTAALSEAAPELVSFCGGRRMLSCFAMMLGFDDEVDLQWQAATVRNADIGWMAVNSSKPGRKPPFTLVVHSSNSWADAHIDDAGESVLEHMLDEASIVSGMDLRQATHRQLHRWRYANIDRQTGSRCFLDAERQLAACGDWCVRGRVEAAFTSASRLAESLVERL